MFKKVSLLLVFGLILMAGTTAGAVNIAGEFQLESSYEIDGDQSAQIGSDLELNLEHSTFSEGFNVNLGFMTGWPDGETEFEIRDAYFDYYGNNFDLRAGKQLVTWGTATGYNPTDNINALNIDDPTGDKESRLLLKGDYYFNNNYSLTGYLAPFHESPLGDRDVISIPETGMTVPIEEVENELANVEVGAKLSARGVNGFDFSLSLIRGHEQLPTIRFQETEMGPLPEAAYFREYLALGADMATSYQGFGLWAEAALKMPDNGDNYGSLVLGGDYNFEGGQVLIGQFIYNRDRLDQDDNYILHQAVEIPFYDYHSARLASFYNLSTDGYLLRPAIEFSLADAVSLEMEYIYQNGEVLGGEAAMLSNDRNQLSASISYSF
ncbi:MAG: DUF1302 family protein [Bacillota bacterium]